MKVNFIDNIDVKVVIKGRLLIPNQIELFPLFYSEWEKKKEEIRKWVFPLFFQLWIHFF